MQTRPGQVAPPISVSSIRPIMMNGAGITVADAHLSDCRVIRFRILSRNPPTIRLISVDGLPADEEAIVGWLQHPAQAHGYLS